MSDSTPSPAPSAAEQQEIDRVARLTDEQVLKESGYGKFGSAIIGKPLAARAAQLMAASGGGQFGPAITDPDYGKKKAQAATAAPAPAPELTEEELEEEPEEPTGPIDPADLKDPRNPWSYVTLSGAKILAQQAGVSHKPGPRRADLIAQLQAAGVQPPPIPEADTDAE